MTKLYTDAVLDETSFILGSVEMCELEPVKAILDAHGIEPERYGFMWAEDEPEIVAVIREQLFDTGILTVSAAD